MNRLLKSFFPIRASFENYISTANGCLDYSKVSNNKFSEVHYNSFADMNGDCRADLFITSTDGSSVFYEIWIKQSEGTFCLLNATKINSDSSLKGVTFTDIGELN